MKPNYLKFSSQDLSYDGTQPELGNEVVFNELPAAEVVARLQAMAAIPGVNLIDLNARVQLSNGRDRVVVQNVAGKLYATVLPEAVNPSVEQTAEQIVDSLNPKRVKGAAAGPVRAPTATEPAPESTGSRRRPRGGVRRALGSLWMAAVLLAVAGVLGYLRFRTEVPEGIMVITDQAEIASLQTQWRGRYAESADPDAAVFVVDGDRFRVITLLPNQTVRQVLLDQPFQFGRVNGMIVLMVANGAVLQTTDGVGLTFEGTPYLRQQEP